MRTWIRPLLTTCTLLVFGLSSQAQGPAAAPGTYQLMTTNPKVPEVYTTDLRVFIEAHRALDHEVLLKIGRVTWVRIFSQAQIEDPGFQPGTEEIIPVDPINFPGNTLIK